MIPIVTPAQMRAIDEASTDPVDVLIDRAGSAVARQAIAMMGGAYGRVVNVIVGPGNNGADGRVAAQRLAERGVTVRVFEVDACPRELPDCDLVVDAAYGTGFRDSWAAPEVGHAMVLAVDIPSGLDALSGVAHGPVLRADATVTFAALKPGLLVGAGPQLCGEIRLVDIGLSAGSALSLIERSDVARWLPRRARDAHKWSSAVRVVAGSPGMTGAARLVSEAAQRSGAGMVHLTSPGLEPDGPTEVVARRTAGFDWHEPVLNDLHRFHSLVIGPGLGREDYTVASVSALVADALVPVVLDGDGLFAVTWNPKGKPTVLREREVPTVITPHDGEYGVLTGRRPGSDRVYAARWLAADLGVTVLLKGPATVVSSPTGQAYLIDNGDERLATAGTGDVLAGIIGALIARGLPVTESAAAGAWIHAEAANRSGARGVVAGDLVGHIGAVLGDLQ